MKHEQKTIPGSDQLPVLSPPSAIGWLERQQFDDTGRSIIRDLDANLTQAKREAVVLAATATVIWGGNN